MTSAAQAISDLAEGYSQGRDADLPRRLATLCEVGGNSVAAAAVSAFISDQLGLNDSHGMAPLAADMVQTHRLSEGLVECLIEEARHVPFEFEPDGQSLSAGSQGTIGRAFRKSLAGRAFVAEVGLALEAYRREVLSAVPNRLMSDLHCAVGLHAWFTHLPAGGRHSAHIHQCGRVSGTLYLQAPDEDPEGCAGELEFGPFGLGWPERFETRVRVRIKPRRGLLVLFPSCLAHRTSPARDGPDRMTISFDIQPKVGGAEPVVP